jgi:hypothetical protein
MKTVAGFAMAASTTLVLATAADAQYNLYCPKRHGNIRSHGNYLLYLGTSVCSGAWRRICDDASGGAGGWCHTLRHSRRHRNMRECG